MAAGAAALHEAGSGAVDTTPQDQQRPADDGAAAGKATERREHSAAELSCAETATEGAAWGVQLPDPEVLGGLDWRWLDTQPSSWTPDTISPTMNLRLDGRIVPSDAAGGARVSFSHLVVLDGFFGEPERQELMGFLTSSDAAAGPSHDRNGVDGTAEPAAASANRESAVPGPRWKRATADRAGLPPTWGLKVRFHARSAGATNRALVDVQVIGGGPARASASGPYLKDWQSCTQEAALRELATADLAALREVQMRLARLYPEYAIAHMPSEAIQQQVSDRMPGFDAISGMSSGRQSCSQGSIAGAALGEQRPLSSAPTDAAAETADDIQRRPGQHDDMQPHDQADAAAASADCNQFVGNAAVYGDCFRWHIDADPAGAMS